jgi:hypothetical protein
MYRRLACLEAVAVFLLTSAVPRAGAQSALSGEPIRISRTAATITIDGDLSDEGWRNATRVDKWYETQPGDNVEPKVRSVGYLTYDVGFFMPASSSTIRTSRPSVHRSPTATTSVTVSTTTAAS